MRILVITSMLFALGARAEGEVHSPDAGPPEDASEVSSDAPSGAAQLRALEPSAALTRGVQLFEQQELEQAEVALMRAAEGQRYSREEVVRLLHHLGVVRAYLGKEDAARATFARLLAVSPSHFLPYTISPRTAYLFNEVREGSEGGVSLSLISPQRAAWEEPIEVRVELQSDPRGELREVELLVRQQGSANYRAVPVKIPPAGGDTRLKLDPVPRPNLGGDVNLELALVARGDRGWELYRGPDPANQRVVAVGLVDKAWYEDEGTLWILGGTAAAAVVGTVFLAALVWPPPEQVPVSVSIR